MGLAVECLFFYRKNCKHDIIVKWSDCTENIVYADVVSSVDDKPLAVGSNIEYYWKPDRKMYIGTVVDL